MNHRFLGTFVIKNPLKNDKQYTDVFTQITSNRLRLECCEK